MPSGGYMQLKAEGTGWFNAEGKVARFKSVQEGVVFLDVTDAYFDLLFTDIKGETIRLSMFYGTMFFYLVSKADPDDELSYDTYLDITEINIPDDAPILKYLEFV
jgi:hypothetical protein